MGISSRHHSSRSSVIVHEDRQEPYDPRPIRGIIQVQQQLNNAATTLLPPNATYANDKSGPNHAVNDDIIDECSQHHYEEEQHHHRYGNENESRMPLGGSLASNGLRRQYFHPLPPPDHSSDNGAGVSPNQSSVLIGNASDNGDIKGKGKKRYTAPSESAEGSTLVSRVQSRIFGIGNPYVVFHSMAQTTPNSKLQQSLLGQDQDQDLAPHDTRASRFPQTVSDIKEMISMSISAAENSQQSSANNDFRPRVTKTLSLEWCPVHKTFSTPVPPLRVLGDAGSTKMSSEGSRPISQSETTEQDDSNLVLIKRTSTVPQPNHLQHLNVPKGQFAEGVDIQDFSTATIVVQSNKRGFGRVRSSEAAQRPNNNVTTAAINVEREGMSPLPDPVDLHDMSDSDEEVDAARYKAEVLKHAAVEAANAANVAAAKASAAAAEVAEARAARRRLRNERALKVPVQACGTPCDDPESSKDSAGN
ncbi:hypothetical protein BGZ75_008530 [Mortierella antarctica]|nr:hypothetical protein BGZ75_008530 [Mortierella antarctica]